MKVAWSGLSSAAPAIAVAGAVAAAFPFAALTFRAAPKTAARPVRAAFVSLSADEESAALKAAKNSWNADAGAVRRLRAELFVAELPELGEEPAPSLYASPPQPSPETVEPGLLPYQPSQAAAPAAELGQAEAEAAQAPAFTREELLKME